MESPQDITRLLQEMRAGQEAATPRLIEAVYPELRKIAARCLRAERNDHTLQATALVNEAYLQLVGQTDKDWHNRAHFFAVAAQVMRRVLVDYARTRKAYKRGGRLTKTALLDNLIVVNEKLDEVLAVDAALTRLSLRDPRQAKVVEMRCFGGLTETEIALVLDVAPRTIKRDWAVAKAWLYGELNSSPRAESEAPP